MTPAARVQAAITILDSVIGAAKGQGAPADRILADWARANRYAGSKDRRAVRELVYGAIRACGPVPGSGRAAMLRLAEIDPSIAPLFDGSNYGPQPVGEGERAAEGGAAPEWLSAKLAASGVEDDAAEALLERAPLDVRVNTLKASRDDLELPVESEPLAAPNALRLPQGTNVEQFAAYRDGKIEVQDLGSQIACMAVGAQPGQTVIDLCAGAGGKTLALAAAMGNEGTLVAADTDRGRLSRLGPRAERAGARIAETILLNPGREMEALEGWRRQADAVLVDAPCSGTGTWRRNPEARWRLTPQELERLIALQSRLLAMASELVKPGGRIVFVTCSLLDEEGPDRVGDFLANKGDWRALPLDLPLGDPRGDGVRLSPHTTGTDGFFIAGIGRA